MDSSLVVSIAATLTVAVCVSLYTLVFIFSNKPRAIEPSELKCTYYDCVLQKRVEVALPETGSAESEITLSVIVPSYNEVDRIYIMLKEALEFFQSESELNANYEILIVDDGSSDGTFDYVLGLCAEEKDFQEILKSTKGTIRCVQLAKNRGKGGAVRHGMLHARGEYILFADADGASRFRDCSNLIKSVSEETHKKLPSMAIGSRAHMVNTDAVVKRSFIRNFLMYGLHTLLFIFGIRSIRDTQCGFKLFNRYCMLEIFPYLHTERWIFDVEILILGIRKQIPIHEVPISWHEVGGSKVDLARDSINMAIDLVVIRLAYLFGIYKDH